MENIGGMKYQILKLKAVITPARYIIAILQVKFWYQYNLDKFTTTQQHFDKCGIL